jgi:hypothetical protein
MFVTASFLPGIAFAIAFMLNTIALSYGSLNYIPLGTLVRCLLLRSDAATTRHCLGL